MAACLLAGRTYGVERGFDVAVRPGQRRPRAARVEILPAPVDVRGHRAVRWGRYRRPYRDPPETRPPGRYRVVVRRYVAVANAYATTRSPAHQASATQMSPPTGCPANRSRIVFTMAVTG